MMAVGASGAFAGRYDGAWTTQTLVGGSTHRPAVATRGVDDALAMVKNGSNLSYSTFDGSWSGFAQVGAVVTTRATPSVAASATTFSVVFHGDDFKHYYAAYTASFSPTAELVGTPQSFGPDPAAIVFDGANPVIAFTGDNGDLFDQARAGGTWQATHAHALGDTVEDTPTLVRLEGGELLLVFNRQTNAAVSFATRSIAGTWSSVADIPDALTNDPLSVASLPGGGAIAAFRGINGQVYTTSYDPSGAPVWSSPAPLASPNPATSAPPAVAAGVNSAAAELVYVDGTTQSVMHSRLVGGTWSAPTTVGGSALSSVAVASHE